ncbi:hypothetical protein IRJ41_016583 [Triplophysa rosa]|uniref:Uncharacterized protein n=1 Tax=Triplophysa rosa TaxID=992332 RepID=A0A9W8C919_TRIRA|nr:hypothetical protein IRJ41_016583 [Triplophysa rosa]
MSSIYADKTVKEKRTGGSELCLQIARERSQDNRRVEISDVNSEHHTEMFALKMQKESAKRTNVNNLSESNRYPSVWMSQCTMLAVLSVDIGRKELYQTSQALPRKDETCDGKHSPAITLKELHSSVTKNGVKRNSRAHKEPSTAQQPVLEGATKEAINQKEPYEGPSGGARNRDGDPVAMKKMVL